MAYILTDAKMNEAGMLSATMRDSNGNAAAYIFLGTHVQRYDIAQASNPAPAVVASRAYAAARALRFLNVTGYLPFLRENILSPNVQVNVPNAAQVWHMERQKR